MLQNLWSGLRRAPNKTTGLQDTSRCGSGNQPSSQPAPGSLCDTGSIVLEFWYSPKQALLLIASLFILVRIFSSVTPSFQSPDEFNHIKRAYLLSHGILAVTAISESGRTGAGIDEGLLGYMDCFEQFPYDYGVKVDRSTIRACDEIHYTGTLSFSELQNTAMYFPVLYMPQAVALFIGERAHFTVSTSYDLARLFSGCATLALLLLALMIYPVPPAALAIFLMPMCLFQLGSASLDAMTFGTTALAASLFLRGCRCDAPFSATLHTILAACLVLLATSRIIYAAMTPLLLVLYRFRKSSTYLISFAIVLSLSMTWILFALNTVHGQGAITQKVSSSYIIRYYITHPFAYFAVVFRTLFEADAVRTYWQTFIGILGWEDTPLSSLAYFALSIELLAALAISCSVVRLRALNFSHHALVCAAGAALLLLFLVGLSAWTPHPAALIDGIQGRYFYPILLLLSFGCCIGPRSRREIAITYTILILTAASSVQFAVPRLVARYYLL